MPRDRDPRSLPRLEGLRASLLQAGHRTATVEELHRFTRRFRQGLIVNGMASAETGGLLADEVVLTHDDMFSPEVKDALARVGHPIPNGALHYFTQEQIMGWTNEVAGTAFEQQVSLMANRREIALPDGADHVVLSGRTQAGWDLALMKGNALVGHAQVKLSQNDQTILLHLESHPDIPIVITNHEAAVAAAHDGVNVIDSGVRYDQVHGPVADQIARHLDFAHFVHEWVPEAALAVILTRAVWRWRAGMPQRQLVDWVKTESAKAGISNVAGTLASLTPPGLFARIPTAMTTRMVVNRDDVARSVAQRTRRSADHLRSLLPGWAANSSVLSGNRLLGFAEPIVAARSSCAQVANP
jgi:hypothetical protein